MFALFLTCILFIPAKDPSFFRFLFNARVVVPGPEIASFLIIVNRHWTTPEQTSRCVLPLLYQ